MQVTSNGFCSVGSVKRSPVTFKHFLQDSNFSEPFVGFDIETYSPNGFPSEYRDPVVAFSLAVPHLGGLSVLSYICDPRFERQLLSSLLGLLGEISGAVMLTYYGSRFDVPYVVKRGREYGLDMERVFSHVHHVDLYALVKRLHLDLPRYSQKFVERYAGVSRVVSDVSGSNYHSFFQEYLLNGCLKAMFYNVEDSGWVFADSRLARIGTGIETLNLIKRIG